MLSFWKALKGLIPAWLRDLIPSKLPSTKESLRSTPTTPNSPMPSEPLDTFPTNTFLLADPDPELLLNPLLPAAPPMPEVPEPLEILLRVAQPISVELKHPQPISVELKTAPALEILLKVAQPISIELKTAQPLSVELKYAQPESVELKTPPVLEILPVLEWLESIPTILDSEPFFPGLTTETENLPLVAISHKSSQDETQALPMAVGMPISMAEIHEESSVAMAKKKKTENHTIQAAETKENPAAPSLDSAAAEWSKDPIATGFEAEDSSEKTDSEKGSVTFVSDPYGLGSTLNPTDEPSDDDFDDISDEDEELNLDTDEAAMEETLGRLQERMQAEDAETAKLMAEAHVLTEEQAKQRLADQIAEDEALEKEMSQEGVDEAENDPELLAALPREPEEDEHGNLDLHEMESCIEALLFMSEKPISAKKLRELLGPEMPMEYFDTSLENLKARYAKFFHGFELVEIANGWQFRTKPVRAALAKKLAKIQTQRLSTGAMESLAIIAYKQPVMKDDIDKIRGVDSSHFIRTLLDKKLIKIAGRSELPGRPMLYETTTDFLEVFSLKNLEAMPPLKELESMIAGSQAGNPDDLDPRVRKMRELVSEMNMDDSVSLLYDPKEDEKFLTDIREKVKSIEIMTPTLQAQADEAEAAKLAEKARKKAIADGTLDPQAESFANAVSSTDPGETAEMPIEPQP